MTQDCFQSEMNPKRILFVCTGNSCRSVLAQALMEDLLTRAGAGGITVESAGVFAIEGLPASRETTLVLQALGLDCRAHRTRLGGPSARFVQGACANRLRRGQLGWKRPVRGQLWI